MKLRRVSRRHSAGFTVVELMVALLGGMLLSAAVFAVFATFEGRKRTLTAGNDVEQSGQLALYKLDGWIRSAGASLPQGSSGAYGCPLHAAKSGAQKLPRTTGLPAPFDKVNPGEAGVFRLAPVLILSGQTRPGTSGKASDALVVMSGVPQGGTITSFFGAPGPSAVNLVNSVDFSGGDLLLVADRQAATDGRMRPCIVQQVAAGFSGGSSVSVPLDGAYAATSVGNASLAGGFTDAGFAMRLGNPGAGALPGFMLLGVGDHNVLYSFDLLEAQDTPLQAEADAVFELHAMYGVDTDNDGRVDAWVSPAKGSYTLAALSAGTPAANVLLQQIKAVRLALVLRSPVREKEVVSPGPLKFFTDTNDSERPPPRVLSEEESHYRYRVLEQAVPIRNNLLLGAG
jgi:type IV pilus assembly protein PilW